MRNTLSALFFLFSTPVFAQLGVTEKLKNISTVQQAQQYIDANPELKPAFLSISAVKDTTIIDKRLLRQKKGDVFSVGYFTYKVLESSDTTDYRVNYIFLDGSKYTPAQLDSLKKLIQQKALSGTSFTSLSDQYTMDKNKTHGDTDWFSGEYSFPPEFQDAVKQHKFGEVFFADLPERQWHYVIKKTYNDRVKKHMIILKSIGR